MASLVLGIDVSKDTLAIATYPATTRHELPYTPAGLEQLLTVVREQGVTFVVLEATGGFERVVAAHLMAADIPTAIVNPRQVRDFAKATGRLAKSDPLDAELIAHYGTALSPAPTPLPDAALGALRELVARRQQLVDMRSREGQRLPAATGRVRRNIQAHVAWLAKEIATLDRDIDRWFDDHPDFRDRYRLLRSVPGIGPTIAAVLMTYLPELGTASRQQLAALAGVAPYNCDSGQWRGQRHTWGGRAEVRRALFMAAWVGSRHDGRLRTFYTRLRTANKPHKVALVACMRKLLTILSAMVTHNQAWSVAEVEA